MTDYEICYPQLNFYGTVPSLAWVFQVNIRENIENIETMLKIMDLTLRNIGQALGFFVVKGINRLQLGKTYLRAIKLISFSKQWLRAIVSQRLEPTRKIVKYQHNPYSQLKFYSLGLKIYLCYLNDTINSS